MEACQEFGVPVKDKDRWNAEFVRASLKDVDLRGCARAVMYRPFDERWVAYHDLLVARRNVKVLGHLDFQNVALVVGRQGQAVGGGPWDVVTVVDFMPDQNIFRRGGGTVFPLYRYGSDGSLIAPNLDPGCLARLLRKLKTQPAPQEVFDYVYAVLHSPAYRSAYSELLASAFPRIPPPRSEAQFRKVAALGMSLRKLHLHRSTPSDWANTSRYPTAGADQVAWVKRDGDRVSINDVQGFEGIPDSAWTFSVGGAQPAQKWLKDRVGRTLTGPDIDHYQWLTAALAETASIMGSIDVALKAALA